jgi:hypothetical protein
VGALFIEAQTATARIGEPPQAAALARRQAHALYTNCRSKY